MWRALVFSLLTVLSICLADDCEEWQHGASFLQSGQYLQSHSSASGLKRGFLGNPHEWWVPAACVLAPFMCLEPFDCLNNTGQLKSRQENEAQMAGPNGVNVASWCYSDPSYYNTAVLQCLVKKDLLAYAQTMFEYSVARHPLDETDATYCSWLVVSHFFLLSPRMGGWSPSISLSDLTDHPKGQALNNRGFDMEHGLLTHQQPLKRASEPAIIRGSSFGGWVNPLQILCLMRAQQQGAYMGFCHNDQVTLNTTLDEAQVMCDELFPVPNGWRSAGAPPLPGKEFTAADAKNYAMAACAMGNYQCDVIYCRETYCKKEQYQHIFEEVASKWSGKRWPGQKLFREHGTSIMAPKFG